MTYQRSNGSDGSEGSDTSMFEEEQVRRLEWVVGSWW